MHMSDALISPAVGGIMLAASAAAIGFSVKHLTGSTTTPLGGAAEKRGKIYDEKKIPLMGILGAFVFAGQMINFTIPGTGSSGHIGGGILLAAILGPSAALITLASVLLIQCLFFADGGLLAYGCNVFNMGVTACLIAYPLIYQRIMAGGRTKQRITLASILAVVAGLQLGAFCVVLETVFSGVTELPFGTFLLLMQPIHLAIGLVEGVVTAAVLWYVDAARPELLDASVRNTPLPVGVPVKRIVVVFAVLTVLVGGGLSIFASAYPDGLEWSMEKTAGTAELERDGSVYTAAKDVVEKTAFLPDYGFTNASPDADTSDAAAVAGTSVSGIVGSGITLLLAAGIGLGLYALRKRRVDA